MRADYKLVAKAYQRIGNAYKRQNMLEEVAINSPNLLEMAC